MTPVRGSQVASPWSPWSFLQPQPASHIRLSPMFGLLLLPGSSPHTQPTARRWQETWVPSRKEAFAANTFPHPQLLRGAPAVRRTHTLVFPNFIKQPCSRLLAWGASQADKDQTWGFPQPAMGSTRCPDTGATATTRPLQGELGRSGANTQASEEP